MTLGVGDKVVVEKSDCGYVIRKSIDDAVTLDGHTPSEFLLKTGGTMSGQIDHTDLYFILGFQTGIDSGAGGVNAEMIFHDMQYPGGKSLSDIVANLNVFSSDPATSRGAGEVIYQSTAGTLKVNTQTTNPTTNPTLTEVGGGDFYADGSVPMTGDLTINKASPAIELNTSATSSLLKFLQSTTLKAQIWTTNDYLIMKSYAGDIQIIASESAGEKIELGTNDTIRLTIADALITAAVALAMGGNAITDAAIAGTNSATFKINQDNAGVEASAIEFDRGSVATAARILWSEANDWFSFEEVTGSTKTTIDAAKLQVSDGVNLDGSTGTIKISEDDATGDMVLQVASGDAIVFKAV
ncbi:MAG: hypothetical protein KAJ93_08015 [Methanosarcinales archaeon]|nr:hypothetical protein [Methanosarcinales archaeon]